MRYISTRGDSAPVSFREAVLRSLAPDGGLYVPDSYPKSPNTQGATLQEIAFHALAPFVEPDLDNHELQEIIQGAFSFDAPLVRLSDSLYILELFHGPTAAFKDFGVRFMARAIQKLRPVGETVTVLTATSGDTGGAVAAAFHEVPGVRAVILYPKGKVSPLQEVQIAGFGDNVAALEIEGNFDDCQHIVKAIFADQESANEGSAHLRGNRKSVRRRGWPSTPYSLLREGIGERSEPVGGPGRFESDRRATNRFGDSPSARNRLLSANSINLARLLPQMSYYFWASAQLPPDSPAPTFSVPSGNFGNLTAGLYAKRLGLNASFLAVSNANDVIPRFMREGKYEPGAFVETLTNAMDIADPSNFARIEHLYDHELAKLRQDLESVSLSDELTLASMRQIYDRYGYVADPHTAIAYGGLKSPDLGVNIIVATAHPKKFEETVGQVTGQIPTHPSLNMSGKSLHKSTLPADTELVKDFISAFKPFGSGYEADAEPKSQ